jgi:hypothetical protein
MSKKYAPIPMKIIPPFNNSFGSFIRFVFKN